MFGDKPIIGLREGKIDPKRRMALHAFSGAEENDVLALVFDSKRQYIKVCRIEDVKVEYEFFKKHVDVEQEVLRNATTVEEIRHSLELVEEKRKLLDKYLHSLIDIVTVDKQRRILIPQLAAEEMGLENSKNLYLEGAMDHMNIYPNKDIYHEVKKALIQNN